MDKITDEISDAVLYRNLYTKILSQQIHAENRLHRLMMARQGQDKTFDEHLAKVRAQVKKDKIRIQKLGERLVIMERKEMETDPKTANHKTSSGKESISKEQQPSMFATLFNMESLRDQFKLSQNTSLNEPNVQTNNNAPDSVTPNQNNLAETTIDPKEIEVFFENPAVSYNLPNTTTNTPSHSTKPMDKEQGHSKKLENYPWFASQVLNGDLPKRVSFNDIPDVIAERTIRNERLLANEEAGWNSDYSDDEPEETSEKNRFRKQPVKHYHEPPPDFSYYSYHDRNRRNDPETSPKMPEQTRTYNSLHKKAERQESPKSSPKCPEQPTSREGIWNLANDQGNSPFTSPWEGVISTSLQGQRNDSTQAVPSSTTNNEVFLDDLLFRKTVENNETSVTTVPDNCKNIGKSKDNTTTRENLFKTEPKEQKRIEEYLHKDNDVKQEINEDTELYEHIIKSKRDPNFIKDDALTTMRRQSWSVHSPDKSKKQQKTRGKLASVFRLPAKNSRTPQVIKADKKDFPVTKKVRRRMSLRPLPETPDVVDEHALQCNTADSLDTFH